MRILARVGSGQASIGVVYHLKDARLEEEANIRLPMIASLALSMKPGQGEALSRQAASA